MGEFLANMVRALEFVLGETRPSEIVGFLTERIKERFESAILERNIENFIAYFRVIISGKHPPKVLSFDRRLVQAFIARTDTGSRNADSDSRTQRLYDYLSGKIKDGAQITTAHLDRIEEEFTVLKMPSLGKVLESIRVAMILKWLQGSLMKKMSHALQDHIVVLGAVYGECKKSLISNVEWPEFSLASEDSELLADDYRIFEKALREALNGFKTALDSRPTPGNYEAQFQIVFDSLDRLAELNAEGKLDSIESFKDRIIVSSSLIYVQDDYVIKNDKLHQLIQLFVSMYIKYRDKRYLPGDAGSHKVSHQA